jgi:hypothetical protein
MVFMQAPTLARVFSLPETPIKAETKGISSQVETTLWIESKGSGGRREETASLFKREVEDAITRLVEELGPWARKVFGNSVKRFIESAKEKIYLPAFESQMAEINKLLAGKGGLEVQKSSPNEGKHGYILTSILETRSTEGATRVREEVYPMHLFPPTAISRRISSIWPDGRIGLEVKDLEKVEREVLEKGTDMKYGISAEESGVASYLDTRLVFYIEEGGSGRLIAIISRPVIQVKVAVASPKGARKGFLSFELLAGEPVALVDRDRLEVEEPEGAEVLIEPKEENSKEGGWGVLSRHASKVLEGRALAERELLMHGPGEKARKAGLCVEGREENPFGPGLWSEEARRRLVESVRRLSVWYSLEPSKGRGGTGSATEIERRVKEDLSLLVERILSFTVEPQRPRLGNGLSFVAVLERKWDCGASRYSRTYGAPNLVWRGGELSESDRNKLKTLSLLLSGLEVVIEARC